MKIDRAINLIIYDPEHEEALATLKNYIKSQAPRANYYLRALRRADLGEYAASRAEQYINKEQSGSAKGFSSSVNRTTHELIREAQEIQFFLNRKTHTVKGARAAQEAHIEAINELRDLGYNITNDPKKLRKVAKLLGNYGNKMSRGLKYEMLEEISQAVEHDVDEMEIQRQIDMYMTGEISYNEILADAKRRYNY